MDFNSFLDHFLANAPRFVWLLGAGASRSAGIKTAYDIIYDIKAKLYCKENNKDISEYKFLNNDKRSLIDGYFKSKSSFPDLNSEEEYSFYLEEYFKGNKTNERKYFDDIINVSSPSIGNKIFSALVSMNKIKAIITTNFDDVIEKSLNELQLPPIKNIYSLEGAVDSTNAILSEDYPVYLKIHGDYRYESIKNLSDELKSQNSDMMNSITQMLLRYGLIIAGYSGRDKSLMDKLYEILESHHTFQNGIFWLTQKSEYLSSQAVDFIKKARDKGINANIVEGESAGNFDVLMRKIWNQIEDKPSGIIKNLNLSQNIEQLPFEENYGNSYPVLRLNAFRVIDNSDKIMSVSFESITTEKAFKDYFKGKNVNLSPVFQKDVFFWGNKTELDKLGLEYSNIKQISLENAAISEQKLQRLLLLSILHSIIKEKPLVVKKYKNSYYIVISQNKGNIPKISGFTKEFPSYAGHFGSEKWIEAIMVKLEKVGGSFFFIIKPTIWIEPASKRERHSFDLKSSLRGRKNEIYSKYLDAWTNLLFGDFIKKDNVVELIPFEENNPNIKIVVKNCYSKMR